MAQGRPIHFAIICTLRLLLSYEIALPMAVTGEPLCMFDEFAVEDVFRNVSCKKCPSCPIGMGLSPDCGGFVSYGMFIECKPCKTGKSYSEKEGIDPCSPCGICSDHQDIKKNCTLTSNSICGEGCDKGFYLSEVTGDCQECSWCCDDKDDTINTECKKQGMPSYKQCTVDRKQECTPRCRENQYIVVGPDRQRKCADCRTCPVGYGLTHKCGDTLESSVIQTCTECVPGVSVSDKNDSASCKPCTPCSVGQTEERQCTTTNDTICGKCDKGFYEDKYDGECKKCSHCCGDKEDVFEPECKYQGMPSEKQCSYTLRSVEVCQKKNDKKASFLGLPVSGAIAVILVVLIVLASVAVFCYKKRYHQKCKSRSNYQHLDSLVNCESGPFSPHTQGRYQEPPSVEKPESYGSQETLSFDKSGVLISFPDPSSYDDYAKSMGVEICWEASLHPKLDTDEILLSPVIKLHPHGQDLSQPVKVKIPHSASCLSPRNGWCIEVRQAELTSHSNSDIDWTVPVKDTDVGGNEVSFETPKLLAFAVVGRANSSGGPVKKRMKCVAFAGEAIAGKDFTITLVLLDDCESSFERVIETEKQKGKTILGAIQSLHIEAFTDEAIKTTVQDVSSGCTTQTSPKDIVYEQWSNSFLKIPKEDITFHHNDPSKWEFHCILDVRAGNDIAEVPVYTCFQEDPSMRRHQTKEARQDSQEGLVEVDLNQPSALLISLPPSVLEDVYRLLDMPLRKAGHWRHVGKELHFNTEEIQLFGQENLEPDGSPSTVLFQELLQRRPEMTVAELVQILQIPSIRRYDVVQILRPFLYTQPSSVDEAQNKRVGQQCEHI